MWCAVAFSSATLCRRSSSSVFVLAVLFTSLRSSSTSTGMLIRCLTTAPLPSATRLKTLLSFTSSHGFSFSSVASRVVTNFLLLAIDWGSVLRR